MLKFSKLGGDRNAKWERKSWEGIVWQWWLTMLKSRWGQTQMRKEILRGHCLTMMIGERTPWKGIVWQWWLEKEHPERALFDNDGWRKNILKGHCLTMIIDNAQIKSRWGQKCKMRKNILKDHCLTMMIGERTPWKGIVWQWRLEKEHPERALFDNDDWQCSKVGGDRNAHMLRSTQSVLQHIFATNAFTCSCHGVWLISSHPHCPLGMLWKSHHTLPLEIWIVQWTHWDWCEIQ